MNTRRRWGGFILDLLCLLGMSVGVLLVTSVLLLTAYTLRAVALALRGFVWVLEHKRESSLSVLVFVVLVFAAAWLVLFREASGFFASWLINPWPICVGFVCRYTGG